MNLWLVTAQDAPGSALARGLQEAGWTCTGFADGEAVDRAASVESPDAFLVVEPCPPWGAEGLLSRLQAKTDAGRPVLVLGVDEAQARVRLLDLGADDVLPASVGPEELLARLRRRMAVFRRASGPMTQGPEDRGAVVDALTEVHNRRYFLLRLEDEFRRAQRYDNPLALVLVDLDQFRGINESFGHLVGDGVLRAVAQCLVAAVRETDTIARTGGDEVGCILPQTHLAGALTVAEQIRRDIAALRTGPGAEVLLTASVGVGSHPAVQVQTPEELIGAADGCLARAKREGRNRICLADPGSERSPRVRLRGWVTSDHKHPWWCRMTRGPNACTGQGGPDPRGLATTGRVAGRLQPLHRLEDLMELALRTSPAQGRLLVVDDEENILKSLRRVLRSGDWEIRTALDGERALKILEQFTPEVVISDFRLPGMNGADFLAQVKQRIPLAQRIMLTGHADQRGIEEAINRSEIFRFIAKPWNDSALLLTVQSAFEQYAVQRENAHLQEVTRAQNEELRALNAELEQRVQQRTRLLVVAKREWELSFDSLDLPLAVVRGSDHSVRRANVAYARVAGRPVQGVSQNPPCHQFLFGRDTPCTGCPMKKAISSGKEGRAEIQHKGRIYVLDVYPMAEEGQAVCAYRDVTDERAMTARLVETEKMAAVGQLAGGVAHEINNPLAGILTFAQLMKRDAGRRRGDLDSLQLIEESALRCKRIVESLLQFSRRSQEATAARSTSTAAWTTRRSSSGPAEEVAEAALDMKTEADLPPVIGDTGRWGGAAQPPPERAVRWREAGRAHCSHRAAHTHVFWRVGDTGTGIEPSVLPRIFEPSFTTKPPGQGTGLGLAIAYRIVQDHGGRFEVQSAPGEGSTFTVLLPIPPTSFPSVRN
jgi:two-component system NtrC family sensor kinase